MSVAVDFKNVDIIFGAETAKALAMAEKGATRAEILDQTGAVLGCGRRQPNGPGGRDFGPDGPVRLGQIHLAARRQPAQQGHTRQRSGEGRGPGGRHRRQLRRGDAARMRQKQVAMVFQQFGLLPWRTVEENVGLGLELAGVPDAERKERVHSSSSWSISTSGRANMRMNCPAACSSALAWRAPLPPKRRSC
jgi:glycine betaine/proline transport system ATP-binding protein